MTEAFALQAPLAVSTETALKPQHFSKFEWAQRAYKVVGQYGECVVRTLYETLGRDELVPGVESFVSVVWRSQSALVESSPITRKPWANWVKRLEEAGFLVQIASGRGPQRFLVLKFPEWSIFDALEYAAMSLRRYSQRPDLSANHIANVRNTVLPPVLKEWKRQVALESFEDHQDDERLAAELADVACVPGGQMCVLEVAEEAPLVEAPERRGSRMQPGGGPECSLIYREPMESPLEVGDSSTLTRAREAVEIPPPTPSNSGGSGPEGFDSDAPQTPEAVELDRYRRLRRVFIAMFAQFERRLDPGCASRLSKLYLERGAWPEAMKLTLEEKLCRLFGNGFSSGDAVRFLTADVGEWTRPPGLRHPDELTAQPEPESVETESSWSPPPTEAALARAHSGATPFGRRRAEEVWAGALQELSKCFSAHTVERWFGVFVPLEVVDGVLVGMAPDDFEADWLRTNYVEFMAEKSGLPVEVWTPAEVLERYDETL